MLVVLTFHSNDGWKVWTEIKDYLYYWDISKQGNCAQIQSVVVSLVFQNLFAKRLLITCKCHSKLCIA